MYATNETKGMKFSLFTISALEIEKIGVWGERFLLVCFFKFKALLTRVRGGIEEKNKKHTYTKIIRSSVKIQGEKNNVSAAKKNLNANFIWKTV